MLVVKPEGGPAASVKLGQESCVRSSGIIKLSVQRPSDGSGRESRFHISTPLGIEPGSLMTGSKWVDHWTSGTVCEYTEIAGSPQYKK
jgi:hypothetical protein